MEKITEKYYLGSNKNNFVLYEKRISDSGKENFKNIGYIASLEALHKTLIEKEIRENLSMIENIEKITKMIQELREFTVKYVNEHMNKDND